MPITTPSDACRRHASSSKTPTQPTSTDNNKPIFDRDAIRAPLKFHEGTRRNRGAKESRNMPSRVGEDRLRNPPVRTTSPTGAENKRICRQRIGMQTKINRRYVLRGLASRIYSIDYSIRQSCTHSMAR